MIRFERVGKTFETINDEEVIALTDVTLNVAERSFVTILGPSGCGKSTLLKLVSGLMPPTTGSITINNTQVREPIPDVGFVFQQPVLLPWRDVESNVTFSLEMKQMPVIEFKSEVQRLLELAGLSAFKKKLPRELSGGMQQRVSICRALVHDPQLLLMDEPFGALDAMTREEMSFVLLRIWEQRKKTILFVTHSIAEAVLLADSVVVMSPRPGRISEVVRIDLPRPRDPQTEFTDDYKNYVRYLRNLVFGEKDLTK